MKIRTNSNWEILKDITAYALWHRQMNRDLYKDVNWQDIFALAKQQTVQCLALDGLNAAMAEYPWWKDEGYPGIGEDLAMDWTGQQLTTTRRNARINEAIGKVCGKLNEAHVRYAVMKGQVCASRWPEPMHRVSGDVDLAIHTDDYQKAVDLFEKLGAVKGDGAEFKHLVYTLDKIPWELHFSVHRFGQKRLQRTMDQWVNEDLSYPQQRRITIYNNVKVPVFSPDLEIVHLLLHFVQHIIHEGCGMRQLVDFALVLQDNLNKIVVLPLLDQIEALQLTRAFHVVLYLCQSVLGMPLPPLVRACFVPKGYTALEKKLARKIEQRMMTDGNFGHSTGWTKPKGLWGSASYNLRSWRREITFIPLWPKETLLFPWEVITRRI